MYGNETLQKQYKQIQYEQQGGRDTPTDSIGAHNKPTGALLLLLPRVPALHESAEVLIQLGQILRGDPGMKQPHTKDLRAKVV
jgi:hypothetical protein